MTPLALSSNAGSAIQPGGFCPNTLKIQTITPVPVLIIPFSYLCNKTVSEKMAQMTLRMISTYVRTMTTNTYCSGAR
jgi:hypothetical protein